MGKVVVSSSTHLGSNVKLIKFIFLVFIPKFGTLTSTNFAVIPLGVVVVKILLVLTSVVFDSFLVIVVFLVGLVVNLELKISNVTVSLVGTFEVEPLEIFAVEKVSVETISGCLVVEIAVVLFCVEFTVDKFKYFFAVKGLPVVDSFLFLVMIDGLVEDINEVVGLGVVVNFDETTFCVGTVGPVVSNFLVHFVGLVHLVHLRVCLEVARSR